MSCMMTKTENVAAIASYIRRLLNVDFRCNGMSCPESLGNELWRLGCRKGGFYFDENIFNELMKLNYAAYLGRYPAAGDVSIPAYEHNDISQYTEYEKEHFVIAKWHYKMYKLISFFNYQCCEDATSNSELYKGMCELESALARFIVTNTEDYVLMDWN